MIFRLVENLVDNVQNCHVQKVIQVCTAIYTLINLELFDEKIRIKYLQVGCYVEQITDYGKPNEQIIHGFLSQGTGLRRMKVNSPGNTV